MKTLLITLSLLIFVSVTITAQVTNKSSKVESQKVWFSCPMHPHEMSLKEGECSRCGMKLVKTRSPKYVPKMKGSPAFAKSKYICKMDGTTSEFAGKCSKCGMELEKVNRPKYGSKMKESPSSSESKYICKMDGSTSDKPGKCSKCGMKLTKVANDKEENKP